jgi:hypothetical protein
MGRSHRPRPTTRRNDAAHQMRPPVDEMFPNRHRTTVAAAVESTSRAAGGFPTLGGGVRSHSRVDMAGPDVSAPSEAVGAAGGRL